MNILLVEDDNDSRAYLSDFLHKIGHRVVECKDGRDALDNFEKNDFDMVLSDIKMPKVSGIELLKKITALPSGSDVDIVLFTGHGDVDTAIEALRAGAYDYLLKPIKVEELALIIDRIAKHRDLRRQNKKLIKNLNEVKAVTEETRRELIQLKKAYARELGIGKIGIYSEQMKQIFKQAELYRYDRSVPVLIQGETGTGKEVIAKYIHHGNNVSTKPFIDINCAALSPSIFESELFGYEAGAFTGSLSKGAKGKFDIARGGTLFLDEITEIPLELQAKFLRVIQEKEFYRVGGLKKIETDVRIICAANLDIKERVNQGLFRSDLYYRLNVAQIHIPPLRERISDILPLALMFLKEFSSQRKKRFNSISDEAAQMLLSYRWPGNIRELKNVMDWVVLMFDDVQLTPEHLINLQQFNPTDKPLNKALPITFENCPLPDNKLDLEALIDNIVRRSLEKHNGNKTKTACYLGITRRALYYRLERMGKTKKPGIE
ncbi:sigma-54-dependent transcriptional regulator [Desulfolucanica intricata]|uniref:sigma-54-dependent transcriptional regulator n=1 Tax=Desulfolucanica intricata TaxID=1285191 RepID=UPI00082EF3BF|nr:sigma-54 dependent transcriptional regulator [Desulfolucanica intricata]